MMGTKQLSRAIQRARMKHALGEAKKLNEARFPKPALASVEGQNAPSPMAEDAQAAILIGAESVERALGRRTS